MNRMRKGEETKRQGEWIIVQRRNRGLDDRNERKGMRKPEVVFTVFVENLPEEMDFGWLHQLFGRYGKVKDAFIPKKRSAKNGVRFGFVRFGRRDEAAEAVRRMNGICIRGCELKVKMAEYNRVGMKTKQDQALRSNEMDIGECSRGKEMGSTSPLPMGMVPKMVDNRKSYVEVLKQGINIENSFPLIKVVEEENGG